MDTQPDLRLGVTVICCTKRPEYIDNLFNNYRHQSLRNKELIIILNHDGMNKEQYQRKARAFRNTSVYQLPERWSLGACLNYAVQKAAYPVIAKFDDDDYYAPKYLADSLLALRKTNADIVGKRTHYMYLLGKKMLLLRFPGSEHRYVSRVAGATLVFRKRVFRKIRFSDRSLGEDVKFCKDSKANGFTIYSNGKTNFAAVRRQHSAGHTWVISDQELLANKRVRIIRNVHNFKKAVTRALMRKRK